MEIRLKEIAKRHGIPAAAGVVVSAERVLWRSSVGEAREDSIFRLYSMTKAVTSVAAMQLVERGLLTLDDPASMWLPELGRLEVLEGFDAEGEPRLRPASKAVTARHLLTHTSGFGYEFTSPEILRYSEVTGKGGLADRRNGVLNSPLLFEPGEGWQYGVSTDWLGKLVEAASGDSLGGYLKGQVFEPLGMKDTCFGVPEEKWGRVMKCRARREDGGLEETPNGRPGQPVFESGGGGLYGTVGDYCAFLQMMLRGGAPLLLAETMDEMARDQVAGMAAGRFRSTMRKYSLDADLHPGHEDGWGLGFLVNRTGFEGGRSAGSLGWGGLANTFYWVDRARGIAAVVMMQVLPFFDAECIGVLREFEEAVYRS
ncbi:MAG: beta-lactamase family protein [Acidobacteria bacterium]|nr:beta-lactamase family protein [Acidobacteriota bacterium]